MVEAAFYIWIRGSCVELAMRAIIILFALAPVGCDSGGSFAGGDDMATRDATMADDGAVVDAAPMSCSTTISYGQAWIHPAQHPAQTDTVDEKVAWDGTCTDDGADSFAVLSNGFKPYFSGHSACVIALDWSSGCGAPSTCTTRVRYGANWLRPANHGEQYDEVAERLFSDGICRQDTDGTFFVTLSNGWVPHFSGSCAVSFEYENCGGLYRNPVIAHDCPDPGALVDGKRYVLTCTSGNAANAFPLYTSTDLVSWTPQGHIFASGSKPSWAMSDFWAPEIHRVGTHYVAYYTARNTAGHLSIGAASSSSPLGPFTDRGQPLLTDPQMGLIDATEFSDTGGAPYLAWKEDGNAVGKPTPIHGQALAADGMSLTGTRKDLITNDQTWEGAVVEAPWVVARGGYYYLFYSGNAYFDGRYAIGVARASSPLGPYVKQSAPILITNAAWVGPGHGSVIDTPRGDTYVVYHAWQAGHVNGPGDGRLTLTDALFWRNDWPVVPAAPSSTSRPMP
jgi:arabinan endo-1,5-alpha-L-arabinosidase